MYERALQLSGPLCVRKTHDELFDDLAATLMTAANGAVGERGEFHLALSGGSTPEPFFLHLVIDPRFRFIPWQCAHVWFVDERRVPEADEQSNYRMIRESLVDHLPMKRRQVHPMPVLVEDPADAYEAEIRRHVPDGRLDFVLLGMGDDAHTASLFPGSPAQQVQDRWIAVNDGPTITPPDRVTMTYPLLNAARQLAVLVTGAGKAETIRRVDQQLFEHGPDPQSLPITGVMPQSGELLWFLDHHAAGEDP